MARQSVITLIKYQALGNDYLFINSSKFKRPTASFVKKVCHRNFGIGSDGVLYGGKSDDGIFSIEIINPDGSIAEMSGNGIRIFARAMVDLGLAQVEDSFNIRTIKKEVSVTINDLNSISVNMGKPLFIDDNIPQFQSKYGETDINGKRIKYYPVSVGNPHCVVFVDEISTKDVVTLGPRLEKNYLYPQKTNVQLAHVINDKNIEIGIWERGAGYTLSSGSSACAVFAVASFFRLCSESATIHMPGGDLQVEMNKDGEIIQSGSVEKIASCNVDNEFMRDL